MTKIPFEHSALPQQHGETAAAHYHRQIGAVLVEVGEELVGSLMRPTVAPLERAPGEGWADYLARAGDPLEGEALALARDGVDVPDHEATVYFDAIARGRAIVAANPEDARAAAVASFVAAGADLGIARDSLVHLIPGGV